jgi:hypothetical protein
MSRFEMFGTISLEPVCKREEKQGQRRTRLDELERHIAMAGTIPFQQIVTTTTPLPQG